VTKARRFAAAAAVWRVLRNARRPDGPGLGERLAATPRLALATLTGRYGGMARGRLALFALAAAYVVSPVDLMPEAAFWVVGYADDVGVAAWLTGALLLETDRFLDWERTQTRVVPGEVVG
jgi:uncharacterized membrane protein YkvA (DUF1232 family)